MRLIDILSDATNAGKKFTNSKWKEEGNNYFIVIPSLFSEEICTYEKKGNKYVKGLRFSKENLFHIKWAPFTEERKLKLFGEEGSENDLYIRLVMEDGKIVLRGCKKDGTLICSGRIGKFNPHYETRLSFKRYLHINNCMGDVFLFLPHSNEVVLEA